MVPALEAIGLTKQYRRGALALSNVSLQIASGSITALVGPNAAGKSTLIRTWVGFERPTAGSVRVSGIDPRTSPGDALRHLGYVPQQPALYRELTTADHLDLAAHLRAGFDRASAERHLDDLAIPLGARATTLSGGQQAQVMLAVALGTRADVLLLDEPLASLDPLARSEFLTVLRGAVRERGSTALLSSHIVTDVEQVCDRLVVLGIGHVLLDDDLAHAVASHGVRTSGDPVDRAADDASTTIGRFPTDAGELITLLRVEGPVAAHAELRPATLDEVVKGYLSAARHPQRSTAAA
jgi:ABC-2 type transport system ATP-binding protein